MVAIRDALVAKHITRNELLRIYEKLVNTDVNKFEHLLVAVAAENLA